MQELVEYIVRRIVDDPDQVSVVAVESGHSVTYEISVAQEDLGQVIGRRGRIANALRTLVRSTVTDDGKRHSVDILS